MKNIKPVKSRVVVLPDPAPEKTASGLIVPESAKEPPQSGKVTHVSGDVADRFKVGDHVLFAKNSGFELDVEGVKHFLMWEDDIYATI